MTGWERAFLVSLALGLLATAACSRGVPQAEYDKARADLATAQGQAKELETQLGSAKASLGKANADLAQAKSDSDKAKADLAAALARAQKLEGDLSLGLAQARDLQTELGSAKTSLDKARADLAQTTADYTKARADLQAALARVQRLESDLALAQGGQALPGSLATIQAYAKVTDLLFLDSFRQQLGLEPKSQYAEAELLAELANDAESLTDPVLKAIWLM